MQKPKLGFKRSAQQCCDVPVAGRDSSRRSSPQEHLLKPALSPVLPTTSPWHAFDCVSEKCIEKSQIAENGVDLPLGLMLFWRGIGSFAPWRPPGRSRESIGADLSSLAHISAQALRERSIWCELHVPHRCREEALKSGVICLRSSWTACAARASQRRRCRAPKREKSWKTTFLRFDVLRVWGCRERPRRLQRGAGLAPSSPGVADRGLVRSLPACVPFYASKIVILLKTRCIMLKLEHQIVELNARRP